LHCNAINCYAERCISKEKGISFVHDSVPRFVQLLTPLKQLFLLLLRVAYMAPGRKREFECPQHPDGPDGRVTKKKCCGFEGGCFAREKAVGRKRQATTPQTPVCPAVTPTSPITFDLTSDVGENDDGDDMDVLLLNLLQSRKAKNLENTELMPARVHASMMSAMNTGVTPNPVLARMYGVSLPASTPAPTPAPAPAPAPTPALAPIAQVQGRPNHASREERRTPAPLTALEKQAFDALREKRDKLALPFHAPHVGYRASISSFVLDKGEAAWRVRQANVAMNRALLSLLSCLPRSVEQLPALYGWGDITANKSGAQLLAVLDPFRFGLNAERGGL
jgi:hypothetical protein